MLRSIVFAVATTVICLALGFPTAYFMATRPPSQRTLWVFLITIPFWSNLLVRTLAVMLIIRDEGLINDVLMWLGIDRQRRSSCSTPISRSCWACSTASCPSWCCRSMPAWRRWISVWWRRASISMPRAARCCAGSSSRWPSPASSPAACWSSFPAIGAYVTPLILGGGKHLMIGDLIALQFGSSRNWPLGSAQALILMAGVLVALLFYVRTTTGKAQALHG